MNQYQEQTVVWSDAFAARTVQVFVMITIALGMAGCGLVRYVEPAPNDPQTARIRFVGPSNSTSGLMRSGITARFLERDSCASGKLAGTLEFAGEPMSEIETRIRAGEPVRLRLTWWSNTLGTTSSCSVPIEFQPTAGAEYTMNMFVSGKSCSASLVRLRRTEPGQLISEPVPVQKVC